MQLGRNIGIFKTSSLFFLKKKAVFTQETYHPSQTGYPPQNPCQIDDLNDVKNRTVSTLIKVVILTDCINGS